jgi:hypothetical protein
MTVLQAVLNQDTTKIARAVILRLIEMCGTEEISRELGFDDLLIGIKKAEALAARAAKADPLALIQLKLLATSTNALLAKVVDEHPDLAEPLIRADVTWPVNLPCYESTKGDLPMDRLRKLGFGANAKTSGIGALNGFGAVGLLLHNVTALRGLLNGTDADQVLAQTGSETEALAAWHTSARKCLDDSVKKVSDLPLDEIDNLRNYRHAEPSGEARFKIKKWFLRVAQFANGLLHVFPHNRNGTN